MYPIFRFALATAAARRARLLPLEGVLLARHPCLPGDIDPWPPAP